MTIQLAFHQNKTQESIPASIPQKNLKVQRHSFSRPISIHQDASHSSPPLRIEKFKLRIQNKSCSCSSFWFSGMLISQEHLWALTSYEWRRGTGPTAAVRNIRSAGDTITVSTVNSWSARLAKEDTVFKDKPRAGAPKQRKTAPLSTVWRRIRELLPGVLRQDVDETSGQLSAASKTWLVKSADSRIQHALTDRMLFTCNPSASLFLRSSHKSIWKIWEP